MNKERTSRLIELILGIIFFISGLDIVLSNYYFVASEIEVIGTIILLGLGVYLIYDSLRKHQLKKEKLMTKKHRGR